MKYKENLLWKIFIIWGIVGMLLMFSIPKEYSQNFIVKLILCFPLCLVVYSPFIFIILVPIWIIIKEIYSDLCKIFSIFVSTPKNIATKIEQELETKENELLQLSERLCRGARVYLSNGAVLETVRWNNDYYVDVLGLGIEKQILFVNDGIFLVESNMKEHFLMYLGVNDEWNDFLFKNTAFDEYLMSYILRNVHIVNICNIEIRDLCDEENIKKEKILYDTYIKYMLQRKGYKVEISSIRRGSPPVLICRKGSRTLVVLCKNCNPKSKLHAGYIYQLSNFVMDYSQQILFELKLERVSGIFYTTAKFTHEARGLAKILKIKLVEHCQIPIESKVRKQ